MLLWQADGECMARGWGEVIECIRPQLRRPCQEQSGALPYQPTGIDRLHARRPAALAVAAALRLQGGALLGAADAFGELTSAPAPPAAAPSPVGTPTGALAAAGTGAAGFGMFTQGPPPAVGMAGPPAGPAPEASNPYHSAGSLGSGGPVTGSLAADRPAGYSSGGGSGGGSLGSTKRFSEPEAGDKAAAPLGKGAEGGVPAARYPVTEQPAPSDNPYSVRNYSYA